VILAWNIHVDITRNLAPATPSDLSRINLDLQDVELGKVHAAENNNYEGVHAASDSE
jgi:hypothetical protein